MHPRILHVLENDQVLQPHSHCYNGGTK